MPLPFVELVNRVRLRCGNLIDDIRAEAVLADKVQEIWRARAWHFKKEEGILATEAPKTTGTVTLNATPTLVDGTGTAFVSADVGRKLRVNNGNTYYTVTAVTGQQLTLERAYVGAAFTAQPYSLFRNIYDLAPDVDEILSMAYWWRLGQGTVPGLDRYDGRRTFTSNQPRLFVYRGETNTGTLKVEISPVPSSAIGIRYVYNKKLPTLTATTVFAWPDNALIYLASADALRIKALELASAPQSAGVLSTLQQQANDYEQKGLLSLEEYWYQSYKIAGGSQAVRDIAEDGNLWSDDYYTVTDINSPIF